MTSKIMSIDKLSKLTTEDFYFNYLIKNQPCIFNQNFTSDWKCRSSWKDNSKINLKNLFQFTKATDMMLIADCNRFYFDSHLKSDMTVQEFLVYWNGFQLKEDDRLLYLKDWHYFLGNEKASDFFVQLNHFSSDWFNEFSDIRRDVIDDYRFVYVGVKGSWTGFHVDVLRSYSWSANVIGKKRWILFPPGFEKEIPANTNDIRKFAGIDKIPHIDVIQEEGEIIFVPSGWFHQVENITDCVSLNHNWINGFNACSSWEELCRQLEAVERETSDVSDTPGYIEQCQVCLKAYSGMNFEEFIVMTLSIIYKRFKKLLKIQGKQLEDISDSSAGSITFLGNFFERVISSELVEIQSAIDWTDESIQFDIADIDRAFRVLQLIADHPRCQTLQLLPQQIQQFVQQNSNFIKTRNKFAF